MNGELKQYLEAMEARLREHTEAVETRLLGEFRKWATDREGKGGEQMADEKPKKTIDERIDALTMNLELQVHMAEDLRKASERQREAMEDLRKGLSVQGENLQTLSAIVRTLAQVVNIHQGRLDRMEGTQG